MAKSKEVAQKPGTAVSTLAAKRMQAGRKGFKEATRDAFAMPFIRILQDLSPQVKKKMAGYIEGARPGQFLNTVSGTVADSLRVVPCYYSQSFIEWTPRDEKEGQGFVAAHPPGDPIILKASRIKGRLTLPNGHILMDTRSHFVLVVKPDGSTEGALIAMASTGIKVSRKWMSQMNAATVPGPNGHPIAANMFDYSYKLTTEEEANAQGSWYQWVVSDRQEVTSEAVWDAALAFSELMEKSATRVDYSAAAPTATASDAPADLDNEIDA